MYLLFMRMVRADSVIQEAYEPGATLVLHPASLLDSVYEVLGGASADYPTKISMEISEELV